VIAHDKKFYVREIHLQPPTLKKQWKLTPAYKSKTIKTKLKFYCVWKKLKSVALYAISNELNIILNYSNVECSLI